MGSPSIVCLTSIVFTLTYAGLALGKVPGLRMDRAGIALVGAAVTIVTGILTLPQAVAPDSIDYETLILLFGMMIVVGCLRLSGFFGRLAHLCLSRIETPKGLLAVTILLSGVLSAFLVNDIVCLALTPLILHLARRLRFNPVPHLMGLATAANIGSTATVTGNPQNMIIGIHSHISYLRFADSGRAGEAQVLVGSCLVFGSALGPLFAGSLVEYVGYRGLFDLLAATAGLATLIVLALVPETLSAVGRGEADVRQSTANGRV